MLCGRVPGLTPGQRQLCSDMPDAFIALGEGQQLGAHECQHQFRGHRWNCTEVWQRNGFAHVMPTGEWRQSWRRSNLCRPSTHFAFSAASREASYIYAIASAAATYAVTAACAKGNISMCGCDVQHTRHKQPAPAPETENFKWGGCSADVEFGMRYARKFMDARELERDARTLMNQHNNRVGRTVRMGNLHSMNL